MQKNFQYKSTPLPSDSLITKNAIFTSKEDMSKLKKLTGANNLFYIKIKGKIIELKEADGIGEGCVSMGRMFRQMLQIGGTDGDKVNFEYMYDRAPPKTGITRIKFLVLLRERGNPSVNVEDTDLIEEIKKNFVNTPINDGQLMVFKYNKMNFNLTAEKLEYNPMGPLDEVDDNMKYYINFGFLSNDTEIDLVSESSNLKIKSKKMKRKKLTKIGFKFEEMGVGGLDKEIGDIFRRAFTTRLYPAAYLAKYGISHVKGMLLYGPPGTGKTLIARTLANALNVKEFKVVNGPELFDKYVGETEKKIRDLFKEAEQDQQENGEDAGLHVIVFDEIDSICRARGTINSGTGVHDGAVNQLLTKIDGVDSLNDILVIGMTNRKDLIDEAILRPGRLGIL